MCGFLALLKQPGINIETGQARKIKSLLHHRGPDGHDFYQDEKIFLCHTRLSILDLDKKASQPMISFDKRYVLVFNGEIYNQKDLKIELAKNNYSFKTSSDTEVLLTAFHFWGKDVLKKLVGMFSFVIYDFKTNQSFIVRDRLGIKPLYIAKTESGIVVSSEIRPILLFIKPRLNKNALWSYFNFRFTQGQETLFDEIKEVTPGHFIKIGKDEILKEHVYWDLRGIQPHNQGVSDFKEQFNDLFYKIMDEHFQSDVPVASLLSGGVDSAFIASTAVYGGHFPKTYTFNTGLKDNECEKARAIAKYLNLENEIINTQDDDFKLYDKAIYDLEDPLADSIILPTSLLLKNISQSHKVLLSGEGADEIFSGYIHHQILGLEKKFSFLAPSILKKTAAGIFNHIPANILDTIFPYPSKLGLSGQAKVVEHIKSFDSNLDGYIKLCGLFTDSHSSKIFNKEISQPLEFQGYWNSMEEFEYLDKLKRFDLFYWGRNYTLHRLDKLSMAHSVEARVPYFDHRLVELVLKIKSQKAYNLKNPKQIFRKQIKKTDLPRSVIRRKKQAFYLPVENIFSKNVLKDAKERVLDNISLRNIYSKQHVESFLSKDEFELLDAKQFLAIYNFELWHQRFLG